MAQLNTNKMKIALIIGVTRQDGAYLSEFLLKKKDYKVHGLKRLPPYLILTE